MERWIMTMRAEKGVPTPFWGSLLHGILLELLPEEWRQRLHKAGVRPFSQWVETRDGSTFRWHLNALNDDLAASINSILVEGVHLPCKHLQGDFIIEGIEREKLSIQAYTKPFFLKESSDSRLRLSFLTTTTHKTQGEYALFPSVELVARSLRERICEVAPDIVLSDDEALDQIIAHTRIARYRLQSGSFALEGARIQGYTGHVDLSVYGPDPLIRLANMLFCFAPWCGVGIKTALGMGGCLVEAIDYRKGK